MQLQCLQQPLCGMLHEMESHSTDRVQETSKYNQHRPCDEVSDLCRKKYPLVYA